MSKEDRRAIHSEIEKLLSSRSGRFVPGESRIQYAGHVIDKDEISAIVDSILDGWFGMGKHSSEFSSKLAGYIRSKYTVLTNSGSSANLLAVSALMSEQVKDRLKYGDEAIVPAGATFPTTINPLIQNGLKPVLVDVEIGKYDTTPEMITDAISEKTRLIVLPHTLGNPNKMDEIMEIAESRGLRVIEDSCDALGSMYDGRMCGTFGVMGTFSFYPAHHMTTGEGGAVCTDDPVLKDILRSMRDWGRACFCEWDEKNPLGACGKRLEFEVDGIEYDHRYTYSNIGYNLKPLELQAAMGLEQLKKLPVFSKKRKENFKVMYKGISKYEDQFILPESFENADPVWFAFPLTIRDNAGFKRKDLMAWLEKNKIQTRVLFSGNIARQPAYRNVKFHISGKLDNSDRIMKDSFFVGIYPGIGEEQISYMLEKFDEFIRSNKL